MLYTGKGDNGTTKTFGCDQRISKSSVVAEALGTVDELNSLLGWCKVKSLEANLRVESTNESLGAIIESIQQDLFIVQAELAGAEKTISTNKVAKLENWVNSIEKELPPIKSFFVSGGTELGAMFDFARTVSRRAERRTVKMLEENENSIKPDTLAFLNRLSSVLYALARYSNFRAGIKESIPNYE